MKKITRIMCLVFCMVILLLSASGCAGSKSDTGPYINMYLSSEVYNFDPAYAHMDSSAAKLLPLLFEGLFTVGENGKVSKALCDTWKYTEDYGIDKESPHDDVFTMVITLKDSAWTDGIMVSADDFVFAWKRLLDNEFDGEGAELLFDIKGAWNAKNSGASPDDIELYADKKVLTMNFEHSIDPDDFIRKLASISLVPLRRNTVDHYYNWSSASTTILTNGPFSILSYFPGNQMVLGRNTYYKYDVTSDSPANAAKYVTPHKIAINFQLNAEEIMSAYEEGTLFYISELPASKAIREQYAKKVKLMDTLATHMYYFNTNVEPFNNPAVRKALSDVIDRNAIVSEVVFAKPSTGIVPASVNDLTSKDSFAANNTAKLSADPKSISEAKAAISAAGIDPSSYGKFYLTVRVNSDSIVSSLGEVTLRNSNKDLMYNTVDVNVAKMVVEAWNKLGFDFEIKYVNTAVYKESTSQLTQFRDLMVESVYGVYYNKTQDGEYRSGGIVTDTGVVIYSDRGNFDVIALDYQLLDSSAFSALSVFAKDFSGSRLYGNDFENLGHITGYNNEAYNALIAAAYEAHKTGDKATMSAKLHEAEALILTDMPVVPIFVYQNASLTGSKLSGIKYNGWGSAMFSKTRLKNWKDYLPTEE